ENRKGMDSMRWKTLCVALACWGILTTGRPVEAQTSASPPAPANTPDQLIEKLQRENEALRARLAELERVSGGTSLIKAALDADKPEAPPPARPAIAPPKGPGLPQGLEDSDSPFCLEKGGHDSHPQDLTLWNFFSAGWNEEYTRRDSEGRAPDLALLRVQTNFMEREV